MHVRTYVQVTTLVRRIDFVYNKNENKTAVNQRF